MRILVVDDSEDARDIMAATLESGGYESVLYAESGPDALATLAIGDTGASEDVDVILLDILMPGMDGIEVCAAIRADERYRDVPILMVTSISDIGSLSQAFVAGANDYVTKPFNRVELLARIRSALKLKGELDRRRAREDELSRLVTAGGGQGGPTDDTTSVDAVSGLPGRRVVDALLLCGDNGSVGGIAVFRIDSHARFRSIHDKSGQDDLVRQIGATLSGLPSQLGTLLARYDDDLFVTLLAEASVESVRSLAREAQHRVRSLRIPHSESAVSSVVTLSVGAALRGVDGNDVRSMFADALGALERGTQQGERLAFADDVETV